SYPSRSEAVQQIDRFLESLSLDTIDPRTMEPRLVRLCHARDHLVALQDDLTRIPAAASGWHPPAALETGAQALAGWLDATRDPTAMPAPAIFGAIESASLQLGAARETHREKLLEDVALQRVSVATARAAIETLGWADASLRHASRLAESLRIASEQTP